MADLTPPTEPDRTMIREWILDRIKTDEFLLKRYHEDLAFKQRVDKLALMDDNQEATDLLISIMLGTD